MITNNIVSSKRDFAKQLGRESASVYSALNGNARYLTRSFLESVSATFTQINLEWLLTGRGSMLNVLGDYIYQEGGEGNIGKIAGDCEIQENVEDVNMLQQRVQYLKKLVAERERLINVLMDKKETPQD